MSQQGTAVNVWVCIKCGRESDHFRSYCPKCGETMVLRTKVKKPHGAKKFEQYYGQPYAPRGEKRT